VAAYVPASSLAAKRPGHVSRPLDITEVKAVANDRMISVLSRLGISAPPKGHNGTILICDPMTSDKKPSLAIWTKRAGGLSWVRYGTPCKGDILRLIAYLRGWYDLPDRDALARRWVVDAFNLGTVDKAQLKRDADRAKRQARDERRRDENDLERNRGRAMQAFLGAASIAGTVAEIYLRGRGIDFSALPEGPRGGSRRPGYLRFIESEKHTDDKGRATAWPCLIACMVDPLTGAIGAVHRTWLAPDGSGKAPVMPQRKIWPSFAGLVLPIWRGDSRMSVPEAIANGLRETLVLTEGNEDGLSAVLARPQYRTWGIASLNNLANIVLPECIDAVMIHRQNEWTNAQAVKIFNEGKRALQRQGRAVEEIVAFAGKDLNDVQRGAA
jgi:hypothetical protein